MLEFLNIYTPDSLSSPIASSSPLILLPPTHAVNQHSRRHFK